jgi:hypothetical protein
MTNTNQRLAQLGDRVRDPISGFQGIATVHSLWLSGCVRLGVSPETFEVGKPIDERYFDQALLEVVDEAVFVAATPTPFIAAKPPGGPERERGNYAAPGVPVR